MASRLSAEGLSSDVFLDDCVDLWEALSPCTSSETLGSVAEPTPLLQPHRPVVVTLPNQMDRLLTSLNDIFQFVSTINDAVVSIKDVTCNHLLIYVFHRLLENHDAGLAVRYVNQLRLVCMGRHYQIANVVDISFASRDTHLHDIKYLNFQLMVTAVEDVPIPFHMSAQELVLKSTAHYTVTPPRPAFSVLLKFRSSLSRSDSTASDCRRHNSVGTIVASESDAQAKVPKTRMGLRRSLRSLFFNLRKIQV